MINPYHLQYRGSTFKIAMLDRWLVIANGPKLVDEIRRRPDEELNLMDGLAAVCGRPFDNLSITSLTISNVYSSCRRNIPLEKLFTMIRTM